MRRLTTSVVVGLLMSAASAFAQFDVGEIWNWRVQKVTLRVAR